MVTTSFFLKNPQFLPCFGDYVDCMLTVCWPYVDCMLTVCWLYVVCTVTVCWLYVDCTLTARYGDWHPAPLFGTNPALQYKPNAPTVTHCVHFQRTKKATSLVSPCHCMSNTTCSCWSAVTARQQKTKMLTERYSPKERAMSLVIGFNAKFRCEHGAATIQKRPALTW